MSRHKGLILHSRHLLSATIWIRCGFPRRGGRDQRRRADSTCRQKSPLAQQVRVATVQLQQPTMSEHVHITFSVIELAKRLSKRRLTVTFTARPSLICTTRTWEQCVAYVSLAHARRVSRWRTTYIVIRCAPVNREPCTRSHNANKRCRLRLRKTWIVCQPLYFKVVSVYIVMWTETTLKYALQLVATKFTIRATETEYVLTYISCRKCTHFCPNTTKIVFLLYVFTARRICSVYRCMHYAVFVMARCLSTLLLSKPLIDLVFSGT